MSTRVSAPAGIPTRRAFARLVALGAVLALAAAVACLGLGGGAPQPAPAGLPDPGRLTGWGLPVTTVIADLAALLTVGALLVPTLLLPSTKPELRGPAITVLHTLRWVACAWVLALVALVVFTVSDLLAAPVWDLSLTEVTSFAWQVAEGRALGFQAILVLVIAFASRWVLSVAEATTLLLIAVVALIPPALTGHSASSGSHDLAVVSLAVHIVGASLWVGGLVALLWFAALRARHADYAVIRFSTLATWCLATVLVSGLVNAGVRLGGVDALLTTSYGALVLAKASLLVFLAGLGWAHRRSSLPELRRDPAAAASWQVFARLAAVEVCVMAAAIGVAVALSRTPTPVGEIYTSPVESLLGGPLPDPPTLSRLLFGWTPSGIGLLIVSFGTALYTTGLVVMARKGNRWPVGRTISWFFGLVVVAWASLGGLGTYSHVLFSAHMGSHMLLSMVAPIFLVLGAPVTLALRTLPGPRIPGERSPRQLLTSFLHSKVARFFTHPLVATALFIGSLYAIYFTGAFTSLMESHLGHAFMELHFLIVGCLFFYVLVGVDPAPRRLPPFARMALLLVVMPFHAFFSIAIMSSSTPIGEEYYAQLSRPYQADLLADQDVGGSLSWALGELPIVIVLVAIFVQWVRSDAREARRLDRAADRAEATGDSELAAYNRYLAGLHAHDVATGASTAADDPPGDPAAASDAPSGVDAADRGPSDSPR